MILFELKCSKGHFFEAWFKDGKSFERQAKQGKVECPVCGDSKITKAPMAPAVTSSKRRNQNQPADDGRQKHLHKEMLEAVNKIQKHIEKTCDYVGNNFAEEAKAMHYGEREERAIYVEATDEEAIELQEEEIPFQRLPWGQKKSSKN